MKKQGIGITWLEVQACELHSSSGWSMVGSTINVADDFSCPDLIRFNDGLGFNSRKLLCWISDDRSSSPDDWDPLRGWTTEEDLLHIREEDRVLRFREIQRIEWEMVSRKGYVPIFGMENLMWNNLLSHLEESWNMQKK